MLPVLNLRPPATCGRGLAPERGVCHAPPMDTAAAGFGLWPTPAPAPEEEPTDRAEAAAAMAACTAVGRRVYRRLLPPAPAPATTVPEAFVGEIDAREKAAAAVGVGAAAALTLTAGGDEVRLELVMITGLSRLLSWGETTSGPEDGEELELEFGAPLSPPGLPVEEDTEGEAGMGMGELTGRDDAGAATGVAAGDDGPALRLIG